MLQPVAMFLFLILASSDLMLQLVTCFIILPGILYVLFIPSVAIDNLADCLLCAWSKTKFDFRLG